MKDFNFFSIYIDKKKNAKTKNTLRFSIVASIIIVSIGLYSINQYQIYTMEKRISNLKNVINSKERLTGVQKYEEAKRKLAVMDEYLNAINNINKRVIDVSNINSSLLNDINSTIPRELFITGMNLSTDNINIQGVSTETSAIAELQHNLKSLDTINDVHVNIITRNSNEADDSSTEYIFILKCTYRGSV